MKNYDTIEEVEKHVDEIEVVEKFNPFHDARGRFSNKNGFASYSANPNTKAGAMAIARSAAAGHGKTKNVHRESYGEDVRQNANWLGHHNQGVGPRQTGSGTLRQRVEPTTGLAGASAHGYTWAVQNRMNNRTTGRNQPKNQQQQAQQKPQKPAPAKQTQTQQPQQKPAQQAQQSQQAANSTQSLDNRVKNVALRQGDKLAITPRDYNGHPTSTKKAADNNFQSRVDGKDISKTADLSKVKSSYNGSFKDPIDKMAELQGWNKAPTVTDNLETFQKAAKQSGTLLIRSVNQNYGTGQSAADVCKSTMSDGNAPLGGSGGKVYGSGMYMVGASTSGATGRALGQKIAKSQDHSYCYGSTQMMATVHPSSKIATPTQARNLKTQWQNLSHSDQKRFEFDMGSFIASKGFDGAQWHDRSDPYITMYNKSALIFYSGIAKA